MNSRYNELIEKLKNHHSLTLSQYEYLITQRDDESTEIIRQKACSLRDSIYQKAVYIRGLIEVSNICKNNCIYCGIRSANKNCSRYKLTADDILNCAKEGYSLGFRTFVLQGGEDPAFDDVFLISLIEKLKDKYPDCAITLSLGERSMESYLALKQAGADRYLLRHETADKAHYKKLHPSNMSFENRMRCLRDLKEAGFQTGCGFMVGSPFQTPKTLAKDLKFIEEFKPHMCGIGPFIPHRDTPFKDFAPGSVELTVFLLSVIRLISPNVLLPATTALGTMDEKGREKAILAGANVIMPNLSPRGVRKKYELYDNKLSDGDEAAESIKSLSHRISAIGYEIVCHKGDYKEKGDKNACL